MPAWSGVEIAVFAVMSLAVLVLAWLYCFRMDRLPVFDEIGLHNPIYTYLTTGKMTYPMHGHPDAMFVHPPTHYWVSAEIMKNLGLSLFDAAALPILFFTSVSIGTIFVGRFQFPVAVAALLALFCSLYVWSEFYTVRPDLHVTVAWITGLLLLQAAQNRGWSNPLLFLGSFVSTFAATLHYWGVVSFLAVGVYTVWFLATAPRERWQRGIEMILAGGLLAGGLYLFEFVIPQYENIRTMTSGVQGNRGWHDAYDRHLLSYAAFAQRIGPSSWPSLLHPGTQGFTPRWLVDTLLRPIFEYRIPAIFVAVPLMLIWKQTRGIAIAGMILPAFVLLYSQGKQVGYTGYFTPEIILYLFGTLALLIVSPYVISEKLHLSWMRNYVLPIMIVGICLLALREVPISMGSNWAFKENIDALEANRAAGRDIVGPGAVLALTSAGNWYTAGGEVVWNSYNELYGLELKEANLQAALEPADAAVSHLGNWWNAQKTAVPLNRWYVDGRLQLTGFVLNEPSFSSMDQLFLEPLAPSKAPEGFVIGRKTVDRFLPSQTGEVLVAMLTCREKPNLADSRLLNWTVVPVDTEPGKPGDQLAILVGGVEAVGMVLSKSGGTCLQRDVLRGELQPIDRKALIRTLAGEPPIRFAASRAQAMAAKDSTVSR